MSTITYRGFAPQPPQKKQPPSSNTGVFLTTAGTYGVGWLTCTVKGLDNRRQLLEYWASLTGDVLPEKPQGGILGYQHRYRSVLGLIHGRTLSREDSLFMFAQGALDCLTLPQQIDLVRFVISLNANITRLDMYLDDFSGTLTETRIDSALSAGNRRSPCHLFSRTGDYGDRGFTFYIGSRKSESMVRIYDKRAESARSKTSQPRDFHVRVEAELKGGQAMGQALLLATQSNPDYGNVPLLIAGVIRSIIDFVDKKADSNISRCPLLEWWSKFIGEASKFRMSVPKEKPDVSRVLDWVHKQFGSTLRFFELYFGEAEAQFLLSSIASSFKGKLNAKQCYLLDAQTHALSHPEPAY